MTSALPFENPARASNLAQSPSILLGAALCMAGIGCT
ncbi:MAG: hypothetical protein U1E06_10330 [Tabrizicola sp.]|nr:hypothetical protein [Tabrizicola sp.]MDP3264373.1 hypothetical protein [Tabrizicola sp.]MDP3648817.1 hypothetical protein [Paracoccaceae bacterium]MDZ4067226.1 hypothetical protein [Tabrizicola sp.]